MVVECYYCGARRKPRYRWNGKDLCSSSCFKYIKISGKPMGKKIESSGGLTSEQEVEQWIKRKMRHFID